MIMYLARDIPSFVMYYVNGASCSFLLIESTDSMIIRAVGPYIVSAPIIAREVSPHYNVQNPPDICDM